MPFQQCDHCREEGSKHLISIFTLRTDTWLIVAMVLRYGHAQTARCLHLHLAVNILSCVLLSIFQLVSVLDTRIARGHPF